MTYLNHITLTTGHVTRSQRRDVADDTLAAVAPWLQSGLLVQVNAGAVRVLDQRKALAALEASA